MDKSTKSKLNRVWPLTEYKASTYNELKEAARKILDLPEGIKKDILDGELRQYDCSCRFVGKQYDIIDISDQKCGVSYHVIAISHESTDCALNSNYKVYSPFDEADLHHFSNFRQLEAQFYSDLGPLLGLLTTYEAKNESLEEQTE